jgi:hypothetical protein
MDKDLHTMTILNEVESKLDKMEKISEEIQSPLVTYSKDPERMKDHVIDKLIGLGSELNDIITNLQEKVQNLKSFLVESKNLENTNSNNKEEFPLKS